jgi:hypothetical protein
MKKPLKTLQAQKPSAGRAFVLAVEKALGLIL